MNNSILSHLAKLAFLLFAAGSIFAQPQAGRDYERIPEGLITEPVSYTHLRAHET